MDGFNPLEGKKRKAPEKKSFCWYYFRFDSTESKVFCNKCNYSTKHDSGTNKMRSHLKNKHEITEESHKAKLEQEEAENIEHWEGETLDNEEQTVEPLPVYRANATNQKFAENLINFIASSNSSLALVDNPDFKKLFVGTNLNVPCRQTMSATVLPNVVYKIFNII